jgi:hypothetical protein
MQYYCTIRPEEFKLCVKKTRPPKVRNTMPIPKKRVISQKSSSSQLSALDAESIATLFTEFLLDSENTLTAMGNKAMISLKLGYKSGYQVSIGEGKEWSNVTRETLLDAFVDYLKGEFD